jgi:hypothetical protein
MLRRLLNIASIVCLVLCVALMGMWVRSYWLFDLVQTRTTPVGWQLADACGQILIERYHVTSNHSWEFISFPASGSDPFREPTVLGFCLEGSLSEWRMVIPYWFLVLSSGSLAMLLRMPWPPRFTLRSLFIATTFLAVVLGMIAWLDRPWIRR